MGFNSSENRNTRVVELKLHSDHLPIKSVCVPEINVKLKLPGLRKVADAFVSNTMNSYCLGEMKSQISKLL